MTPVFQITPQAQEDLLDIGRYTEREWGQKQRNKYLRELDSRFQWLAENPKLGKGRRDIKKGYYCYPQGSHLVFYIISSHGIDIIGIPHKSMDIVNYFDLDS